MKNTIIYLIGFPGTGKLTIAKQICARENVRLVDNHLINNPVFSLIKIDGKTPLPDQVWRMTHKVREAVLETITTVSPPDYNFVFTNMLVDNDWVDKAIYELVEGAAKTREATFVPVRLHCEIEENMRRIISPDRKTNLKETDIESAKARRATKNIFTVNHANLMDLDVTNLSPDRAATTILQHARNCA